MILKRIEFPYGEQAPNDMIDVYYSLGQFIVLKWVKIDILIVSGLNCCCFLRRPSYLIIKHLECTWKHLLAAAFMASIFLSSNSVFI